MATVRHTSSRMRNEKSNMQNPVQNAKVKLESETTAGVSKSLMAELSRLTVSLIITSMRNFHKTRQRSKICTAPCLAPRLAPSQLSNIILKNHSLGRHGQTPPTPPRRAATSAISLNQNNFSVAATVTRNVTHSRIGSIQNP
jgi:hypothetical protein